MSYTYSNTWVSDAKIAKDKAKEQALIAKEKEVRLQIVLLGRIKICPDSPFFHEKIDMDLHLTFINKGKHDLRQVKHNTNLNEFKVRVGHLAGQAKSDKELKQQYAEYLLDQAKSDMDAIGTPRHKRTWKLLGPKEFQLKRDPKMIELDGFSMRVRFDGKVFVFFDDEDETEKTDATKTGPGSQSEAKSETNGSSSSESFKSQPKPKKIVLINDEGELVPFGGRQFQGYNRSAVLCEETVFCPGYIHNGTFISPWPVQQALVYEGSERIKTGAERDDTNTVKNHRVFPLPRADLSLLTKGNNLLVMEPYSMDNMHKKPTVQDIFFYENRVAEFEFDDDQGKEAIGADLMSHIDPDFMYCPEPGSKHNPMPGAPTGPKSKIAKPPSGFSFGAKPAVLNTKGPFNLKGLGAVIPPVEPGSPILIHDITTYKEPLCAKIPRPGKTVQTFCLPKTLAAGKASLSSNAAGPSKASGAGKASTYGTPVPYSVAAAYKTPAMNKTQAAKHAQAIRKAQLAPKTQTAQWM